MSSKPQYRYLVKVFGMKDHYKGCKWQPDFWFLSSTYRNDFGHGVPISDNFLNFSLDYPEKIC